MRANPTDTWKARGDGGLQRGREYPARATVTKYGRVDILPSRRRATVDRILGVPVIGELALEVL
jgi:hypothetical protein